MSSLESSHLPAAGTTGVCQVLVHMDGETVVRISGDPDSVTSRGYLCPKGAAAPDMLYHPDTGSEPPKCYICKAYRA